MIYICENWQCEKFGEEDYHASFTLGMFNGKWSTKENPCPKCGHERKEINPAAEIPISEKNIEAARYSNSSPADRAEILKKRSHEHFKKEIEPHKKHRLNEAVKTFQNPV